MFIYIFVGEKAKTKMKYFTRRTDRNFFPFNIFVNIIINYQFRIEQSGFLECEFSLRLSFAKLKSFHRGIFHQGIVIRVE